MKGFVLAVVVIVVVIVVVASFSTSLLQDRETQTQSSTTNDKNPQPLRLKKFAVMSAARCRHERQSAVGSNGYRRQIKCLACGKTLLEIWLGTCQTDLLEKALAANTKALEEGALPFITAPQRSPLRKVLQTLVVLPIRSIRWFLGCR